MLASRYRANRFLYNFAARKFLSVHVGNQSQPSNGTKRKGKPTSQYIFYKYEPGNEKNNISRFYSRNFKTLASFCGCAGRFVSGLVGNSPRHVLSCRGSYTCILKVDETATIKNRHNRIPHPALTHLCQESQIYNVCLQEFLVEINKTENSTPDINKDGRVR